MDDLLPALASVMIRAAIAGMLGPAVKLIRAFSPNFLLKAAWSSEKACRPPKGAWAGSECDLRFFSCSADKFVQYLRFCSDRIYPNNDHHRRRPTRVDHCSSPHLSIFLFRNRVSLESPGFPRQRTMHHGVACELYTQREIVLPASSLGKAHLRWYEIGLTSPSHT